MDIDRDFQTFKKYSEDQICQSITNEAISNNEGEDDERDEEEVKPPSNKKVLEALDVFGRTVHHRSTNLNVHFEYEQLFLEY